MILSRRSRLLDFIGELIKQGKTIITATDDLDIVEEIADRVVMFCEEHEISGEGKPREVLTDYDRLIECKLIHEHRHKHVETETGMCIITYIRSCMSTSIKKHSLEFFPSRVLYVRRYPK